MQRPDWVDDDLYPFADRWADLGGGTRLHYVDEGSGTPILMVHGNPTWSFLYRDVIRELRDDFRCVALDLAGFGLSPAPPGFQSTPGEHADVVARFVEALDLDGYVLMLHDWGGPIGLAAAGRDPGRVAGLVLSNTWARSLNRRFPPAHLWSLSIGGVPGRWVVERFNAIVEGFLRVGTMRVGPSDAVLEHYRRPFPTAAERRRTWQFARAVTGAAGFVEREAGGALASLRDLPALLAWGTADPALGPERTTFAARLPRAELHELRGAGHFVQEDAPGELAAAVREWWARHPRLAHRP